MDATQKTPKEWLKLLPEDVREKYIINRMNNPTRISLGTTELDTDLVEISVKDLFITAFSFRDSPEGSNYWWNLHYRLTEEGLKDE